MFLKNRNIIFKIRRSKVTDYAALKQLKSTPRSVAVQLHPIRLGAQYLSGRVLNSRPKGGPRVRASLALLRCVLEQEH